MSEIKFRAYYKPENRMIYDIQNEFEERIELGMDCFADYLNNDNFIVEQATGTKDRHGKEIYEGDIVKMKYPRDRRWLAKFVVLKDPRSPRPVFLDERISNELFDIFNDMQDYYEIIGNLHENPELSENK